MSGGELGAGAVRAQELSAAEYDVLEIADHYTMLARMVHRAWRDGMLEQGREVAPHRMAWESLGFQDQSLDVFIGREVAREAFRLLTSLTHSEQPDLARENARLVAECAGLRAQAEAEREMAEALVGEIVRDFAVYRQRTETPRPADWETWTEARRERYAASQARTFYMAGCAESEATVRAFQEACAAIAQASAEGQGAPGGAG